VIRKSQASVIDGLQGGGEKIRAGDDNCRPGIRIEQRRHIRITALAGVTTQFYVPLLRPKSGPSHRGFERTQPQRFDRLFGWLFAVADIEPATEESDPSVAEPNQMFDDGTHPGLWIDQRRAPDPCAFALYL
jgi:hypothetical protein